MDLKKTLKKIFNKKTAPIFVTAILTLAAIVIFSCSLNKVGFFRANKIEVNFNDGKALMESPANLSPGETWSKHAYIENTGKTSFFYRLYLNDVEGALAEQVDLCVMIDGEVYYQGKASEFTVKNAVVSDEALKKGERADVLFVAYLGEDVGVIEDTKDFIINVKIDAVQSKNNPDKIFK